MAALGVYFASATDECARRRDAVTDERLVRLDESILRDGCPAADYGVPDWGWTETEAFDVSALERHREEGLSLLGERRTATGSWGLHDPLAAPLLEFWEQLLAPTARFVLVYRAPWSCIAALIRLRPEPFRARADYAVRLWCHHNRRLLDFHGRQPGRCLLVNGDEVRADQAAFVALLADRLPSDFDCADQGAVASSNELASLRHALGEHADAEPVLRAMLARVWPECDELYVSLEQAAELPRRQATHKAKTTEEQSRTAHRRLRAVDLSVILTCFNDGAYLAEAVTSALATCAGRHELIVVDDGSNDEHTLDELERLRASGIQVIVRPHPSGGPGVPRNAGIEASQGRYLLTLDADDRLHPSWAQLGIAALNADSRLGVVYGDAMYFGAWKGRWSMGHFDLARLLERNFIAACAVMRREVWEESGGYDARISAIMWEDWDLWLSAAERGWAFRYLPEVLFDYRIRRNSMAHNASRQRQRAAVRALLEAKHPVLFEQGFAPALRAWHEWAQSTSPPLPGGPERWSGAVPPLERRHRWGRYPRLLARHARHPVMAARLTSLELSVLAAETRERVKAARAGRSRRTP
jgi:GT2 family glycosyltransferase